MTEKVKGNRFYLNQDWATARFQGQLQVDYQRTAISYRAIQALSS